MDFQQLIDWGYSFYAQYPIFCYVVAGILLLVSLWKPFNALKMAFLLLVLATILCLCFYLIDSMNVGMEIKKGASQRTQKELDKQSE